MAGTRKDKGSDALEQLYAATPEEFVAERKRLEKALRDEGRRDEASDLAGRRKPPLPVYAANRLARTRPEDVAGLIATAEHLAAGHRKGAAEAVREAQAELAERVRELVAQAKEATGRLLSEAMEQRLATLLRAAAAETETASLLRRGILSEELEPGGFSPLAGLSLPRAAGPGRRGERARAQPSRQESARRARLERLEAELTKAREELRTAERRRSSAEREVERARRLLSDLEQRLERTSRSV